MKRGVFDIIGMHNVNYWINEYKKEWNKCVFQGRSELYCRFVAGLLGTKTNAVVIHQCFHIQVHPSSDIKV